MNQHSTLRYVIESVQLPLSYSRYYRRGHHRSRLWETVLRSSSRIWWHFHTDGAQQSGGLWKVNEGLDRRARGKVMMSDRAGSLALTIIRSQRQLEVYLLVKEPAKVLGPNIDDLNTSSNFVSRLKDAVMSHRTTRQSRLLSQDKVHVCL